MRDPISWALHAANHPQHALADLFRECQTEALEAGAKQGKCELLKLAIATDNRVRDTLRGQANEHGNRVLGARRPARAR